MAQHGQQTILDTSRWPLFQGLLAKGYQRLDPAGFRRLIERVHRRTLKGSKEPAWRTYAYHGFKVTHDIRHTAQWKAFIQGRHQPGVGHWLRHYASSADTVLDIGANVGIFSLEIASELKEQGRVFAFEPNPAVMSLLVQAIEDNHVAHKVMPVPCALGAKDAVMRLSIPSKNVGAATLEVGESDAGQIEVQVMSFTSWWESNARPSISLIKIDVEGHESAVLAGMWDYLRENKPVIVMEVAPATANGTKLLKNLQELGYRLRSVTSEYPYVKELSLSSRRAEDVLCEPF